MKSIWRFVTKPQNLAVIVAIAGALGFIWKEIVAPRIFPKEPLIATMPTGQSAIADNGGTAINAKDRAVVRQGGLASRPGSPATPLSSAGPQRAEAKAGGSAVNAAGSADVAIERKPAE